MSTDVVQATYKNMGFAEDDVQTEKSALQASHEAKAVADVQAGYVIAKKFPRNQMQAFQNIINSCKRPFLAEQALYAYPKGGQMVEGPSIRMAEELARNWGNVKFGVEEISQASGVSIAEAYAIDLETNTKSSKTFHVPHVRHTKKGSYAIKDSREIYELVANMGARRMRACILAIVPSDIVEEATKQVRKTLESSDIPVQEQVKKMCMAFDELGVSVEMLEQRLGHKLSATIPSEIVTLKSIYKSIKDGMAPRDHFFDFPDESGKETLEKLASEKSKPKLEKTQKQKLSVDKETGEIKDAK